VSRWVRPLLGTGFLGAWTTFSGIAVPTDQLLRDGAVGSGVGYLTASLAGGVAAAYAGLVLGRVVFAPPRRIG
jgi:CrcB protein